MREPGLAPLALLVLLAAPACAAPEGRPRVVFRVHELASAHHQLDRLTREDGGGGMVGLGGGGPSAAAVRRYGALRQGFEERWRPVAGAAEALPLGLDQVLPPAPGQDPGEAFDLAFLEAATPAEAAQRLRLAPAEARSLERLLAEQQPAVAEGLAGAGRFAGLIERLERLAAQSGLEAFLGRAARFYGVAERLPAAIQVELLWSPSAEPFIAATQVGSHMLIPVPRGWGERDEDVAGLLATVVHELGHYFVSRLSPEARAQVARALVDREGILNAGRPNTFDEALQTALGSLVFARDHLPGSFDPAAPLYEPDRGEAYPEAIDALARELEAPLRAHLDQAGAFAGRFLEAGLAAQAQRFGRRPLHFSRACLVLAPRRADATLFQRVFPVGEGAARELRAEAAFARRAAELPSATRWLLLQPQDLQRRPGLLAELGVGWAAGLPAELAGPIVAVAQAAPRGPGLGWDLVVVARDPAAQRRALEALRQASALPQGEPLRVRQDPPRRD